MSRKKKRGEKCNKAFLDQIKPKNDGRKEGKGGKKVTKQSKLQMIAKNNRVESPRVLI